MVQRWMALYDQVEPAPEITTNEAAKAGWTAVTVPAHRAVSAAPATTISRARVLRALIMTPPRAPGVAAPPPCRRQGPERVAGAPPRACPHPTPHMSDMRYDKMTGRRTVP